MSHHMNPAAATVGDILLVGTGPMARAYVDVLKALGVSVQVVGRDRDHAMALAKDTGATAAGGGIATWLERKPCHRRAIVAVGVEALEEVASALIVAGCRSILLEKPGALDGTGIRRLSRLATSTGARIMVGFNRRYFASVDAVRDMAEEDGGVSSAFFDFTELGHRIAPMAKPPGVKEHWFLANSLHVVDLAFHLIGAPLDMETRTAGRLDWHPRAAQFAGCGVSDRGVSFSYRADWSAPGRWKVELFTRKRRLLLCPMEALQVQKLGSFEETTVVINDELDKTYKPGLFRQVEAWLGDRTELACTIGDLASMSGQYERMAGYVDCEPHCRGACGAEA